LKEKKLFLFKIVEADVFKFIAPLGLIKCGNWSGLEERVLLKGTQSSGRSYQN
jgi:hypothetical protein